MKTHRAPEGMQLEPTQQVEMGAGDDIRHEQFRRRARAALTAVTRKSVHRKHSYVSNRLIRDAHVCNVLNAPRPANQNSPHAFLSYLTSPARQRHRPQQATEQPHTRHACHMRTEHLSTLRYCKTAQVHLSVSYASRICPVQSITPRVATRALTPRARHLLPAAATRR